MSCLFTLCLYITGSLGLQSGFDIKSNSGVDPISSPSNEYGSVLGELALHAEQENVYMEFKHLSGINTAEGDWGLNVWLTGITFRNDILSWRAGIGPQTRIGNEHTNDYGKILYEVAVMAEFDGIFVKASKLAGIEQVSVGFIKRF